MIELYAYQQGCVQEIRQAFQQRHKNVLLTLPTGGGKTVIFCYIAENAMRKGNRTLILVHREQLIRQIVAALRQFGVDAGVICADYPREPWHAVQVASVQTLVRRLSKTNTPGLIVVDEAHHCLASTYRTIFDHFKDVPHLGVTATPWRMNGQGMGDVYDTMVLGPTAAELIDMGRLAKPRYYVPPTMLDLAGVRTTAGDYNRHDIAERMDKPTITGDAVAHYKRIIPGKKTVTFCTVVEHAKSVAAQFTAAGIPSESIDGAMDYRTRAQIIERLASGQTFNLTSVDLIGEGFDLPTIEACIMLRPTKSLVVHLQQVGRALRSSPGKLEAFIIDAVGNLAKNGFVEDERDWTLEGKSTAKAEKKELQPRRCETCFVLYSRQLRVCPECGAPAVIQEREIVHVAGDLDEVTQEQREMLARERRKEQGQAATLQELIELGKKRGYKLPQYWAKKVLESRKNKSDFYAGFKSFQPE